MRHGKRHRNLLPLIVGGLALSGALLVVLGRLGEADSQSGWQDSFYSVLLAFTLDGLFLGQQSLLTLLGAVEAALCAHEPGGFKTISRAAVVCAANTAAPQIAESVGDGQEG